MYRNILVPYDFGNSFTNVPDQLKKLVGENPDYMITIFNIISEGEHANSVRYDGKHFDTLVEEKKAFMEPFTDQLDALGLNYQVQFETGLIKRTLLKEIKNNDYDVVVMSNKRSKRDIKHVLGHVTHKIAKRVNTPVIIIK
ncbi:universal stress protein [Salinicoccus sp. YB14-2]|uniref:universal stress protein n=1 Tax=Salinicoccus sp. YB14-2 TaxID=1572701 RepID=UPI00069234E8|nr:universal stress protein [Salinicoccus sp. YB14-2]